MTISVALEERTAHCRFCNTAMSPRGLNMHEQTCKDNPRPVRINCPHCSDTFGTHPALSRHVTAAHPEKTKKPKVDLAGISAARRNGQVKPAKTFDKPAACKFCNKTIAQRFLRSHEVRCYDNPDRIAPRGVRKVKVKSKKDYPSNDLARRREWYAQNKERLMAKRKSRALGTMTPQEQEKRRTQDKVYRERAKDKAKQKKAMAQNNGRIFAYCPHCGANLKVLAAAIQAAGEVS
jgi:hypothetical protein